MLIERTWKRWVYFYIPLTVFVVGTLFPFYWMLITAIRPDAELYRSWRAARNTPFYTPRPAAVQFHELRGSATLPHGVWGTLFFWGGPPAIPPFFGLLSGGGRAGCP